jgi:hypothetical protein
MKYCKDKSSEKKRLQKIFYNPSSKFPIKFFTPDSCCSQYSEQSRPALSKIATLFLPLRTFIKGGYGDGKIDSEISLVNILQD